MSPYVAAVADPQSLIPAPNINRYFQLNRRDLVYLKFIQEAYEGLSFMSTADQKACIVRISYQEYVSADMEELLTAMAKEITLTEVVFPISEQRLNQGGED